MLEPFKFNKGDSMTEWREIVELNGLYEASSSGEIRRKKTGHIMATRESNSGYLMATVCVDGKARTVYVHRVVALAFAARCEGQTQVNHIDGNKRNNAADNLEWVTPRENMAHAKAKGLIDEAARRCGLDKARKAAAETHRKRVIRSDGVVFESIEEAAAATGCAAVSISGHLHGRMKTLKGYTFSFTD
jgi:hypothetical protein